MRRTEARMMACWLETDWFDVATPLRPSNARRLGEGIVKVRAWADRSRPEHSNITIETVYRPLADPSRDGSFTRTARYRRCIPWHCASSGP